MLVIIESTSFDIVRLNVARHLHPHLVKGNTIFHNWIILVTAISVYLYRRLTIYIITTLSKAFIKKIGNSIIINGLKIFRFDFVIIQNFRYSFLSKTSDNFEYLKLDHTQTTLKQN